MFTLSGKNVVRPVMRSAASERPAGQKSPFLILLLFLFLPSAVHASPSTPDPWSLACLNCHATVRPEWS